MTPQASASIPILETDRLLLRGPRLEDFAGFLQSVQDEESTRFTGGQVDRRTAFRIFLALGGSWTIFGAGWWMATLKASGEVIGTAGAFFREPGFFEASSLGRPSDLELSWVLYRPHWKQGFGREAARAALAWGLDRHRPRRVVAYIDAENEASQRIARGLGFSRVGSTPYFDSMTDLWALEPALDR